MYRGPDGHIYTVGNPLPRAFLVSRCEIVDSPAAAFERFTDDAFDPVQAVLVEATYLPNGSNACQPRAAGAPVRPPATTR